MSSFNNQIYTDEQGRFVLSLYQAFNPDTEESFAVYVHLHNKSMVHVLPVMEFLARFEWHDPYKGIKL